MDSYFDVIVVGGVHAGCEAAAGAARLGAKTALVNSVAAFADAFFTPEPALVTRERQRAHLKETVVALRDAQRAGEEGREDIMAEQLRLAARALGKLLGRVDVEDVLDVIFRDCCIRK